MKRKAAILARVSKELQEVESQINDCQRNAEYYGFYVPEEYIFQEKITGMDSYDTDERQSIQDLKHAILNNKDIEAVFMWELSRLSRNPYKVTEQLNWFNTNKIPIYLHKQSIWTRDIATNEENTMATNFIFSIAAFGKQEWDAIRARTQRGKRFKANAGFYVGYVADGYSYETDGRDKRIIIDDERASVIKSIFDMCTEQGLSTTQIARELNINNVPSTMRYRAEQRIDDHTYNQEFKLKGTNFITSKINKLWNSSQVGRVLKNEWYIGKYTYLGYTYAGIPSIVSLEQFEKAQYQLEKNKREIKRKQKHIYPLSGVLLCGECGGTMSGNHQNGQCFYGCSSKDKGMKGLICKCKSISKFNLDGIVWELILNLFNQDKCQEELSNIIKTQMLYSGSITSENASYFETLENQFLLVKKDFTEYIKQTYCTSPKRKAEIDAELVKIDDLIKSKKNETEILAKRIVNMRNNLAEYDIPVIRESFENEINSCHDTIIKLTNEIKNLKKQSEEKSRMLENIESVDTEVFDKINNITEDCKLEDIANVVRLFIKSITIYQLEENFKLIEIEMMSGIKYHRIYNGNKIKGLYLMLSPFRMHSYLEYDEQTKTFRSTFDEYWEYAKNKYFSDRTEEFEKAFASGKISEMLPFIRKTPCIRKIKVYETPTDDDIFMIERRKAVAKKIRQRTVTKKRKLREERKKGLISINNAAKELGIGDRPLRHIVDEGLIELHVVNSRHFISMSDFIVLENLFDGTDKTKFCQRLGSKIAAYKRFGKQLNLAQMIEELKS